MIIIYADLLSPRLEYTCSFVFKDAIGVDFQLTNSPEEFESSKGVKINYSSKNFDNSIKIEAQNILFEDHIESQNLSVSKWNEIPIFFGNNDKNIPFDLFAAIFYLVSRYEEYLDYEGDDLTRFRAIDSFSYINSFLEIPVIDYWIMFLKKEITSVFPNTVFPKSTFTFRSSIDVDSALAYRSKGLYRTIGGFLKDLVNLNFKNFTERAQVILRLKKDPFNTYEVFQNIHDQSGVPCTYFFLLADFGPKDINLPYWSPGYKKIIREVSKKNPIGIHPGYVSNYYPEKLKTEIDRLSKTSGHVISKSRQHYLMLKFPDTYRELMKNGITDDYTMGYADKVGYRAGTSRPFNFFDMESNKTTNLRVHPFAVMDVTLNLYMDLNPEEAIQKINSMIEVLKTVKGNFVPVWHNESLSEQWHWKDWTQVYQQMIRSLESSNK